MAIVTASQLRRVYRVDPRVQLWWRTLCAFAVLNVALWAAVQYFHRVESPYGQWHLYLSGVYVAVCAYRSVLPRIDLERLVVVDSRLSSIFLGRLAATVAEICFGIQLGLLVHQLGSQAQLSWVTSLAWTVPVFMTVAQAFCWHSILTLRHITQAVESLLWAAGFAWMAMLLGFVAAAGTGSTRLLAVCAIAVAVVFVIYVLRVDVPMYLRRHRAGGANSALGLAHGVVDACVRRRPDGDWAAWKADACWLTPYFSAGVWLSIAMVLIP